MPIYANAAFTADAELAYYITAQARLVVGVQNLFDKYPQKNDFSGVDGAKYSATSPFGFNGGFWYLKAQFMFD